MIFPVQTIVSLCLISAFAANAKPAPSYSNIAPTSSSTSTAPTSTTTTTTRAPKIYTRMPVPTKDIWDKLYITTPVPDDEYEDEPVDTYDHQKPCDEDDDNYDLCLKNYVPLPEGMIIREDPKKTTTTETPEPTTAAPTTTTKRSEAPIKTLDIDPIYKTKKPKMKLALVPDLEDIDEYELFSREPRVAPSTQWKDTSTLQLIEILALVLCIGFVIVAFLYVTSSIIYYCFEILRNKNIEAPRRGVLNYDFTA